MNQGRLRSASRAFIVLIAMIGVVDACAPVQIKTRKGVYHEVKQDQTLWRICHAYGVNMRTVCRFNGIEDPERIVVGQKIFIPGADTVLEIEPQEWRKGGGLEEEETEAEGTPRSKGKRPSGGGAQPQGERATRKAPRRITTLDFAWPVKAPVTSWFGVRHGRKHNGIDIPAPKGTSIAAAERGIVVYSGNEIKGYGNVIIVKHKDGFNTVYAHNSKNRAKVDDVVSKGQIIGFVGKTGLAEGYHLHFEIRRGVSAVDPMDYLP